MGKAERVAFLLRHKETLIRYCAEKMTDEDWHGVEDAASDLRDVEAELRGLGAA